MVNCKNPGPNRDSLIEADPGLYPGFIPRESVTMNRTEVGTRRVALVLVMTIGLCVPFAQAQPHGYEGYQVIRVTVASRADLRRLLKLDDGNREFQIWSESVGIGTIEDWHVGARESV